MSAHRKCLHTHARAIPLLAGGRTHTRAFPFADGRTAAFARSRSPAGGAVVLNKYLLPHLVAAAASLCGHCRQGARGIYSLRVIEVFTHCVSSHSGVSSVAGCSYAPLARVLQISRRTRAPSQKYIPQRTRRAAKSPLGVPIRWDRHSRGRPEVLRKSPKLSGGRIYRQRAQVADFLLSEFKARLAPCAAAWCGFLAAQCSP
jgi:hypothetical protein